MGDLVPREELSKQAMRGVGGVVAGVGLLVMSGLAGGPLGWVVGGVLVLVGVASARAKSGRRAAVIAIAAGAATLIGGPLLVVAGIGLLVAGGWSGFQFVRSLRKRM